MSGRGGTATCQHAPAYDCRLSATLRPEGLAFSSSRITGFWVCWLQRVDSLTAEVEGAAVERSRASGSSTAYPAIGLVFALLIGGYFFYRISGVVLAFLLTILLSIILSAPVNYLERRGWPRTWGVLAVLAVLVGLVWLFGLALVPAVETQSREFAEAFPTLLDEALTLVNQAQSFFGLGTQIGLDPQSLSQVGREFLTGSTVSTAAGVGLTLATVLSLGVVVFISTIYLVIRPAPWVDGFVSLFPAGWRPRTREVLEAMYQTVQRWFLGQLAATISVVIPILLALISDPFTVIWVVLAFIIIQQIEGNLLQPIVMSRAVDLHPALVVFAILIMGTLFGLIGVFLAVPLVAALQVLVRELWVQRMDEIGTDPNPPTREPPRRNLPRPLNRIFGRFRKKS